MSCGIILGAACPKFNANKFVEEKLKLLKDFGVTLSEREMGELYSLNSPREIEKFVRIIIHNHLV